MHLGWHHLENAALHALNSVLVLLVLLSMTGRIWRSALVAALFAVHPLHVESVAWLAERKDVLSAFFFLLTLFFYGWYAKGPSLGRYMLVFVSMVLGLLSKPMLVTTPFVLLLLDVWPLDRWRPCARESWMRLIAEKIPLLALSLFDVVATLSAQRSIVMTVEKLSFVRRCGNAAWGYVSYLWKTAVPDGLCAYHPLPVPGTWWPLWQTVGSGMLLLVITVLVLRQVRRRSYLPVGWFWYLGMLIPVIGLVQVGIQSWADRYSYLPLLGIFIALVWLAGDLIAARPAWRRIAFVLAGVVTLGLASVAWWQAGFWRNPVTLWGRVTSVHGDHAFPQVNFAKYLLDQGQLEEAEEHARRGVALFTGYAPGHSVLGEILSTRGKAGEAVTEFREVVSQTPADASARFNLAQSLVAAGDQKAAIHEFREALLLDPGSLRIHQRLCEMIMKEGDRDQLLVECREMIRRHSRDAGARYAAANFLAAAGFGGEAREEFSRALRMDPANPHLLNDYAWLLATSVDGSVRDGRRAVELALEAEKLTAGKDAGVLDTLAAAYAEAGDFGKATATARHALELAQGQGNKELERSVHSELELYALGKPVREGK